jgi:hypothetical protein
VVKLTIKKVIYYEGREYIMTEKESYKEEWTEYYQYLEDLRASGDTNMLGATPYLQRDFDLEKDEASEVLLSWLENYSRLVYHGIINRDGKKWSQKNE